MQNVSLQQAVKMTGKSESTIRRDVKSGKVSAERDRRGHIRFDAAELARVYGELKSTGDDDPSSEQGNGSAMTGHDSAEIIASKDNTIADLRSQLEKAEQREDTLIAERSKLLDLASRLQAQTDRLILPGDVDNKPNWVQRLLGAS